MPDAADDKPTTPPRPHRFGDFRLPRGVRVKSWQLRADDGSGDVPDRKWDGWWCAEGDDQAGDE